MYLLYTSYNESNPDLDKSSLPEPSSDGIMGMRQPLRLRLLLLLLLKVGFLYSAAYALYNLGSGSWLARANGAAAQTAAIQLHVLTYNWTSVMQLANTPALQSTRPSSCKHSPDVAIVRGSLQLTTQFFDLERMKGWVGLVGRPVVDGLPT